MVNVFWGSIPEWPFFMTAINSYFLCELPSIQPEKIIWMGFDGDFLGRR
jgi:hypothetical protein